MPEARRLSSWRRLESATSCQPDQVAEVVMGFHSHAIGLLRKNPIAVPQSIVTRLLRTIIVAFSPEVIFFAIDQAVYDSDLNLIVHRAGDAVKIERVDHAFDGSSINNARSTAWETNFSSGKTHAPYAKMRVVRGSRFTHEEEAYLQLASSDFEHLIQTVVIKRFEASLNHHLGKAMSRIESQSIRPGTILADLVFGATHSIQADVGLYASTAGDDFHVDYIATRRHRRASVASHWGKFDRTVAATLGRQPFHWFAGSSFLPETLSRGESRRGLALTDHSYLLIPIKDSSTPVGCYAFGFANDRPTPTPQMVASLISTLTTRPLSLLYQTTMQRNFAKMIVEPIYRGRDTRIETGKCGVLMPFTAEWSTRIWGKVLKPSLVSLGFHPVRADDLFGTDVMEDVWQMILSSEVVVAEISGRNANVFYELGLAHSMGKPVILLTQNVADIPFDLNRYRHIIYQDNVDGYETLNAGLAGMLKEIVASRPKGA